MFGNKRDNEILTLGREGSGKVFKNIVINGLDLFDLLKALKDKKIAIVELSENAQTLYEGNGDNYTCERVKYEVLKFEKVIYNESYMIIVRNLIMNKSIKFDINEVMNNQKCNTRYADKFWYNIGLRYFELFINIYPGQLNFHDDNLIKEIILSDKNLSMYKEPFLYVKEAIRMILSEFTVYNNISDREININEIIKFCEKRLTLKF